MLLPIPYKKKSLAKRKETRVNQKKKLISKGTKRKLLLPMAKIIKKLINKTGKGKKNCDGEKTQGSRTKGKKRREKQKKYRKLPCFLTFSYNAYD